MFIPLTLESPGKNKKIIYLESDNIKAIYTTRRVKRSKALLVITHQKGSYYVTDTIDEINDLIRMAKEKESREKADKEEKIRKTSVDKMDLPVRAENVLSYLNIKYVEELTNVTARQLLSCKNFGIDSLTKIVDELEKLGLYLKKDPDYPSYDAYFEKRKRRIKG